MKFNLSTSGYLYNDKEKKRLKKLGFAFDSEPKAHHIYDDKKWYMDIFGTGGHIIIEINTLEELLEFQKNYGQLIIGGPDENGVWLEIYDGYRE